MRNTIIYRINRICRHINACEQRESNSKADKGDVGKQEQKVCNSQLRNIIPESQEKVNEAERSMLGSIVLRIASVSFIVTAEKIVNIVFCQNGSPHKLSTGMEFNITAVEFVFDKLSVAHGGGYVGMS